MKSIRGCWNHRGRLGLMLGGVFWLGLGGSWGIRQVAASDAVTALEDSLDDGFATDSEVFEPHEPGGNLRPSERFSKIPLRPPMTDANWRRWAGPQLDKKYLIRRRDSLWNISERLFGNPYVWPKVWHLNSVFGNPHVIDPGIELLFVPGNPNSAPALAYKKNPGDSSEFLPLLSNQRPLSFLEHLEQNLRRQLESSHPPFRFFLTDGFVEPLARIPGPENSLRAFYEAGDTFGVELENGTYNVVRLKRLKTKVTDEDVQVVQWIGTVRVTGGRASIEKAFLEIGIGDQIVARDFTVSLLTLHEDRLGEALSKKAQLVPIQEGYSALAAEQMLIGINFGDPDAGPKTGSLLSIRDALGKVGTLLILERSGRTATAWIAESKRELQLQTDRIE